MENIEASKKWTLNGEEKAKNRNSYTLLEQLDLTVRSYNYILTHDGLTSNNTITIIPKDSKVNDKGKPIIYNSNFNVDRLCIYVCTGKVYDYSIGIKIHEEDFQSFMSLLKIFEYTDDCILRTKDSCHSYYYFIFRVSQKQFKKIMDLETITFKMFSKKATVFFNDCRVPMSGYLINKNNNRSYMRPKTYCNPCILPDILFVDIVKNMNKPVTEIIAQPIIEDRVVEVRQVDEGFELFLTKLRETNFVINNIDHAKAVYNALKNRNAMTIPKMFKDIYKHNHVYDSNRKIWYSVNKYGIYKQDTDELLSARINISTELCGIFSTYMCAYIRTLKEQETRDNEIKYFNSIVKEFPKLHSKKTIIEQLKELYQVKNLINKVNPNKYLFAFDNGVYDLKTFTFRNALREDLVFETNGYSYKPSTKENRKLIKNTIKDMFVSDELYIYFMTIISLRLVRINELEEFYFLIGNASNGKGLMTSLIQETFGNFSQILESSTFYKSKHGVSPNAPTPELASTKDSNIVFVNELDRETKLTAAMVKKLSGNDKIKVRFLRQDCFEFIPGYSLFFVSNHEPNIDGDDFGIQRRLKFIPFNVTFKDEPTKPNEKKVNRELKQLFKKKALRCAFFDVLVKFYRRYLDNNKVINVPEEVKIKSKKYLACNDPVMQFVTKTLEVTDNEADVIQSKKMIEMFSTFNNGMRGYKPGTLKTRLTTDFGIKWKKTAASNIYYGVKPIQDNQNNIDFDI